MEHVHRIFILFRNLDKNPFWGLVLSISSISIGVGSIGVKSISFISSFIRSF